MYNPNGLSFGKNLMIISIKTYGWMMNPHELVRPPLRGLPKTVHGGQGWRLKGIEDYSHNLNPFGPPDISEVLQEASEGIGHYPDDGCKVLKETIAKSFGVGTENVIVGSGSSDIIRMFPNTFLGPGDRAVISRPSFAEYSHQCRIVGAEIIDNLLLESDEFRIDYDSLKRLVDKGAKAVYICNPNNPTGRIEPRDRILSFVEHCAKKNALVFLDETLLELVPDYDRISCVRYVNEYPNLIVAGSLTKSFAIPGIRIGFGFSNEDIIQEMDKVRMTWNVGQFEQSVAEYLIRERMDYVHEAARTMHDEADWMYGRLKDVGFPVVPTDSYFFFNSVAPLGIDAKTFVERMQDNGILVRDCSSFGGPFTKYVRFCVKDRPRNERFIDAVNETLRSLRW